jgi:hypothetical protein
MSNQTQEQLLQEILNLKKEHPDLEIKICVSDDDLSDEGGWSLHKISTVKIETWFEANERIYTDESYILDYLEEQVFDEYPDFSCKRIRGLAEMRYLEQVKEVICVYTCA